MDPATLLTLSQTILQLLDSHFVKEVGTLRSFKSHVAKLKDTMITINAVLLDAEEQERQQIQRSNVDCDWLIKLRDVFFEADDLFDEIGFVTQRINLMPDNKLSKEVRIFFSRSNQLAFAYNMSRKVKRIRERLDDIAKDRRDFGSTAGAGSVAARIVIKRREDSHSFVHAEDVIGRDEDKKFLLDMLLDPSVQENVHFVAIVGIGGLGKTTLAQLIYNDETIMREFPLRLWVCVSNEFDIKMLLFNLLKPLQRKENPLKRTTKKNGLPMDDLQSEFQKMIGGKKYLLVLDDVWNEDRHQWLKLRELLMSGESGSRVVVTTRSKRVASIIGECSTYELEGLSENDSWHLFEKMAFVNEEERMDLTLIEIGKHILKKCANVPLAIRVVGSILYDQSKSTWLSFKNKDLARISPDDENGIMPILKLSYHHLSLPLKSCFSYCALFPKDYSIKKPILISLWMANGFITPLEGQRIEDVGEEYFMSLLQRCFFQDVERDDIGEIVTCKLHDLMHDVAKDIARTGMLVEMANPAVRRSKENARHLSFQLVRQEHLSNISLGNGRELPSKARYLRVLCLCDSMLTALPSTIDELVHLRYLDLSSNYLLKSLPETLCKLNNLQTLRLYGCSSLWKLPRNLSKLVNLRHLDNYACNRLRDMPPRMSNLTCLERLSLFVVNYNMKRQAHRGNLEDLEALKNLGGSLHVRVNEYSTDDVTGVKCVIGLQHLKDLYIWMKCHGGSKLLLKSLQPHPNLRCLYLNGYEDETFSCWESSRDLQTSIPNLVKFSLSASRSLLHLPLLSRLRHLKVLELRRLHNLEYIESTIDDGDVGNTAFSTSTSTGSAHVQPSVVSFPSLESLQLQELPNLKVWQRTSSRVVESVLRPVPYLFPRLFNLEIRKCPKLTSIPQIPHLTTLILSHKSSACSSPLLLTSCSLTNFRELTIEFSFNNTLNNLSPIKNLFTSHCSSLSSLVIKGWRCLEISLCGGGMEHLTALQELRLQDLDDLEEFQDCRCYNMMWKSLGNLCHLQLKELPKLVSLPQGIQYLTALQSLRIEECHRLKVLPECMSCLKSLRSLHICRCYELKSLPEAMHNLTSLTRLEIIGNYYLTERCQKPYGKDWSKIQHIPHVFTGMTTPENAENVQVR